MYALNIMCPFNAQFSMILFSQGEAAPESDLILWIVPVYVSIPRKDLSDRGLVMMSVLQI